MLLAQNLTIFRSGHRVLDALDLHVARREIVALVGPEHAGKTTALECFLGLHHSTAGRAVIQGATESAAASLVRYVPRQVGLPAHECVLAYVRDVCLRHHRRIPDSVLRGTLERNGVSEASHFLRIGECLPAVQRHLALTLAWLANTPALLIDEPSRDLTPADTDTVVRNLRGLRKGDRAILLATRDLAFARRIATRIVILDRGAVVETFDPNVSRRVHEEHSFLAELIG